MSTLASKSQTAWQRFAFAVSLSLACAVAQADPVSVSGSLTNCADPALVGSGPNMPAPSCTTPQDQSNNVALYTLSVPFGGFTDFTFGGFSDVDFTPFLNGPAAAPLVPTLSIFRGTGNSAAFVVSTYQNPINIQASGPDLHVFLTAGTYTLAISTLTNLPFAQFNGGTLGQGFTGRGSAQYLGDGRFQLTATPVPEPDGAWLAAIGLAALLLRRRQRRANESLVAVS